VRKLASCGEKTRKFRILRGTTSIIIMDTHNNKAVCLVEPGSFHKKVLGVTVVNMGSTDYRFHCTLLYFTVLEDVVQT